MKCHSPTIATLSLALVQVSGESKVASSNKRYNRKLIPYIDKTLLSFLDDSSYGRKTVINLIVNQYTNTTAKAGCDKIDLLDSAIEAIDFCETDGEPVPIIDHDFLFVGSVGASRNHASIKRDGITHIINWSNTAKCNLFKDVDYLCVSGVSGETEMQNHLSDLDYSVDFIESARKSGGKVLIHCWYGLNRSVTNIVAYLMKYEGMNASDANDLVNITRLGADPYFEALDDYSTMLEKSNTQSRSSSTAPSTEREESTTSAHEEVRNSEQTTSVPSTESAGEEGAEENVIQEESTRTAPEEVGGPLEEQRMELPNNSCVEKSTVLAGSVVMCILFLW